MAKVSIESKRLMVKELSRSLGDAGTLIVTNYNGLNAQEMNKLRRELRKVSADYIVIKDSLARISLSETKNSRLSELISGEVGIAINKSLDPTGLSKGLIKFAKEHEYLKIIGGILNGELISEEDIKMFATLPSLEAMRGKLASALIATIQGLAGSLNAVIAKLGYALDAVKKKKENTGQN